MNFSILCCVGEIQEESGAGVHFTDKPYLSLPTAVIRNELQHPVFCWANSEREWVQTLHRQTLCITTAMIRNELQHHLLRWADSGREWGRGTHHRQTLSLPTAMIRNEVQHPVFCWGNSGREWVQTLHRQTLFITTAMTLNELQHPLLRWADSGREWGKVTLHRPQLRRRRGSHGAHSRRHRVCPESGADDSSDACGHACHHHGGGRGAWLLHRPYHRYVSVSFSSAVSSVRLCLGPLPWLCHQFVSVSFSSAVSSVRLRLVLFLGCVISLCPCPFRRQYHQYACVWSSSLAVSSVCVRVLFVGSIIDTDVSVLFLGCVIGMCQCPFSRQCHWYECVCALCFGDVIRTLVAQSFSLAVSSVCVYLLLGRVTTHQYVYVSSLMVMSSVYCVCVFSLGCHQYVSVSFRLCHQYVPVFFVAVISMCLCLHSWLCHQYICVCLLRGCHQ